MNNVTITQKLSIGEACGTVWLSNMGVYYLLTQISGEQYTLISLRKDSNRWSDIPVEDSVKRMTFVGWIDEMFKPK